MASPRSSPLLAGGNDPPAEPTVPDEDHGVDLPMSMTASVILTNLPKDASQALADVEALDDKKSTCRPLSPPNKSSIPISASPIHSNSATCTVIDGIH
jgi:hypothetical protein